MPYVRVRMYRYGVSLSILLYLKTDSIIFAAAEAAAAAAAANEEEKEAQKKWRTKNVVRRSID